MVKISETEAQVVADNLNYTIAVDPAAKTTKPFLHEDLVAEIRKAAEDYIREQNLDDLIDARFKHMELLNRVMEATVLAMAEKHETACRQILHEILRMIVCIQVELLECAADSPRKENLERDIDERLMQIGNAVYQQERERMQRAARRAQEKKNAEKPPEIE